MLTRFILKQPKEVGPLTFPHFTDVKIEAHRRTKGLLRSPVGRNTSPSGLTWT